MKYLIFLLLTSCAGQIHVYNFAYTKYADRNIEIEDECMKNVGEIEGLNICHKAYYRHGFVN